MPWCLCTLAHDGHKSSTWGPPEECHGRQACARHRCTVLEEKKTPNEASKLAKLHRTWKPCTTQLQRACQSIATIVKTFLIQTWKMPSNPTFCLGQKAHRPTRHRCSMRKPGSFLLARCSINTGSTLLWETANAASLPSWRCGGNTSHTCCFVELNNTPCVVCVHKAQTTQSLLESQPCSADKTAPAVPESLGGPIQGPAELLAHQRTVKSRGCQCLERVIDNHRFDRPAEVCMAALAALQEQAIRPVSAPSAPLHCLHLPRTRLFAVRRAFRCIPMRVDDGGGVEPLAHRVARQFCAFAQHECARAVRQCKFNEQKLHCLHMGSWAGASGHRQLPDRLIPPCWTHARGISKASTSCHLLLLKLGLKDF